MKIVRSTDIQFVPAAHEDPNKPGVWKKVLLKRDDLIEGRVQMVNWAKLPVGSSFQLHAHQDMEEVFILITGKVIMKVGDHETEMQAGDVVVVPPQANHAMKNVSAVDVEYIVFGVTTGDGTGKTVII